MSDDDDQHVSPFKIRKNPSTCGFGKNVFDVTFDRQGKCFRNFSSLKIFGKTFTRNNNILREMHRENVQESNQDILSKILQQKVKIKDNTQIIQFTIIMMYLLIVYTRLITLCPQVTSNPMYSLLTTIRYKLCTFDILV